MQHQQKPGFAPVSFTRAFLAAAMSPNRIAPTYRSMLAHFSRGSETLGCRPIPLMRNRQLSLSDSIAVVLLSERFQGTVTACSSMRLFSLVLITFSLVVSRTTCHLIVMQMHSSYRISGHWKESLVLRTNWTVTRLGAREARRTWIRQPYLPLLMRLAGMTPDTWEDLPH